MVSRWHIFVMWCFLPCFTAVLHCRCTTMIPSNRISWSLICHGVVRWLDKSYSSKYLVLDFIYGMSRMSNHGYPSQSCLESSSATHLWHRASWFTFSKESWFACLFYIRKNKCCWTGIGKIKGADKNVLAMLGTGHFILSHSVGTMGTLQSTVVLCFKFQGTSIQSYLQKGLLLLDSDIQWLDVLERNNCKNF